MADEVAVTDKQKQIADALEKAYYGPIKAEEQQEEKGILQQFLEYLKQKKISGFPKLQQTV